MTKEYAVAKSPLLDQQFRSRTVWQERDLAGLDRNFCLVGSPTVLLFLSYFPVFGSPTATIEVVGNTGNMSSEKAGVGGSTPSLATIILKRLAESRLALPVRSQSAVFRRDPVRFLATMMAKDLNSNCLSLSPLSVRYKCSFLSR